MTKTALITGITGQDGSYLAEFLLAKGYEVHGIKRRASLFNTQRIDHIYEDPHNPNPRLKLHYGDLTDSSNLTRILSEVQPDEVYNRQYGIDYRSVMPTNLYGPGDNFHPTNSHVMPAMMRRFHEAVRDGRDEVVVWGTGTPRREFLHVDDMAEASLFAMDLDRAVYEANTEPMMSHINVGTGTDVSIRELAELLADVTGFKGRLVFDTSKPDGTPRKLMNVSRLSAMGWRARTELRDGVEETYRWFLATEGALREV